MFTVRCSNVQRQKLVFEFNCQEMNMFCVRSMFKVLFDEHLVNIIMPKICYCKKEFNVFFCNFEKVGKCVS